MSALGLKSRTIEDFCLYAIEGRKTWHINSVVLTAYRLESIVFTYKQVRDALYRIRTRTGDFRHVLYGYYERIDE